MKNEVKSKSHSISWSFSHCPSYDGIGNVVQVWQYVNDHGDGVFSCMANDYDKAVYMHLGVGYLSMILSNELFAYIVKHRLIPRHG